MKGSTVSRRVSEFLGVALVCGRPHLDRRACHATMPSDPVWFFSTGPRAAPANFAGRVGAFLAELSFQLVGYAAYLVPALLVVIGWHYFWCRRLDAAGTKAIGAGLLLRLLERVPQPRGRTAPRPPAGRPRAGGYAGEWLRSSCPSYLNRTGSVIVVLTLIALSTIISTQFSFGRLFAGHGRDGSRTAARRRSPRSASGARSDAGKSSGATSSRSTRRRRAAAGNQGNRPPLSATSRRCVAAAHESGKAGDADTTVHAPRRR